MFVLLQEKTPTGKNCQITQVMLFFLMFPERVRKMRALALAQAQT